MDDIVFNEKNAITMELERREGVGKGGEGGCGHLVRVIHMSFYYFSYTKIHAMERLQFTTLLPDA